MASGETQAGLPASGGMVPSDHRNSAPARRRNPTSWARRGHPYRTAGRDAPSAYACLSSLEGRLMSWARNGGNRVDAAWPEGMAADKPPDRQHAAASQPMP